MNDLEPLYLYIAKRRQDLGYTQRYLADRLGYTPQAISKFESGENEIALNVLPMLRQRPRSFDELIFSLGGSRVESSPKPIRRSTLSLLTKNLWALALPKEIDPKARSGSIRSLGAERPQLRKGRLVPFDFFRRSRDGLLPSRGGRTPL
jgi:transcriptional regulator with XRE-family HTH domain